jgi:hypothetical protein
VRRNKFLLTATFWPHRAKRTTPPSSQYRAPGGVAPLNPSLSRAFYARFEETESFIALSHRLAARQ